MHDALDYLKDELATLDREGLLLHPRTLEGPQGARARYDGREVINLASNNYLGLANHPRLNEAASRAAAALGAGSGAVRTIAGQMTTHRELESRFAAFKHADAALMFQSGFTSNSGTVAAILTKDDVIVSDRLNHASIIDGARLSRAEIAVFDHRDAGHADSLLADTARAGRRQLLVTDGVFSMDGDIAPLPDLVEVAERRGAIMMIDDAHASGVLGPGGAGTVAHFGLEGRVDVQVGTLSKAIGVLGGFIAGPHHLIEWLQNRGRPYLFSTSAPPAVIAACIAALDVIDDEPERLERLWSNTSLLKDGLHELGFDTGSSAEHGLDPDRDVQIRAVPPPEMVANLRADNIDGYLGPDPFNQRAVFDGVGFIHLLTRELWDGHPCCAFAVPQRMAQEAPNTFAALLRAIIEATAHADKPENRKEVAAAISAQNYLNQPQTVVEQVLTGTFADGLGRVQRVPERIGFDPFPWQSMAVWILTQMKRWGQVRGDLDYPQVAEQVFLALDAGRAMRELGLPVPASATRGFSVMGRVFDPAQPAAWTERNIRAGA